MKLIELVLLPPRLPQVREALAERGIEGLTVAEVQGLRRGAEDAACDALGIERKLKLLIALADDRVQDTLAVLRRVRTPEDERAGGMYVSDMDDAVRIRTGERGPEAL